MSNHLVEMAPASTIPVVERELLFASLDALNMATLNIATQLWYASEAVYQRMLEGQENFPPERPCEAQEAERRGQFARLLEVAA